MTNKNSKVVIVLTATSCSILIATSLWLYSPDKVDEDKSTLIEEISSPIDNVAKENTSIPLDVTSGSAVLEDSTIKSDKSEVKTEEKEKGDVAAEVESSITNSMDSDEVVARAWFNLKSDKGTSEDYTTFLKEMESFLNTGSIPQVVGSYSLIMAEESDYGFLQYQVETMTSVLNVITLVAPEISGVKDRTVLFVQKVDSDGKVSVSSFKGLTVIPSEKGVILSGGDYYFLFAGEVLGEEMYSVNGTCGVYGIKVSDDKVSLVNLDGLMASGLEVSKSLGGAQVNFKSSESLSVYFYNTYQNEGQMSDQLYLVAESLETSTMYAVNYEGIPLLKEVISTGK